MPFSREIYSERPFIISNAKLATKNVLVEQNLVGSVETEEDEGPEVSLNDILEMSIAISLLLGALFRITSILGRKLLS